MIAPDISLVRYILFSGLFGFAAFCLSYATHVWRRRNRVVAAPSSGSKTLRRWSAAAVGLACLTIAAAAVLREVLPLHGTLVGEQLFTLRAEKGTQIELVAKDADVEKGQIIARVSSAELSSQLESLKRQKEEFEADHAKLLLEPLAIDPELTRRHQNVFSRRQQLRASRDQILPAREQVARNLVADEAEKRERIAQLDVSLATAQGSLDEALNRLSFVRNEQGRTARASTHKAVSESTADERLKDLKVIEAEIAKLKQQTSMMNAEKKRVQQSLESLRKLNTVQLRAFDNDLEQLIQEEREASRDETEIGAALQKDFERAQGARTEDLRRLEKKAEQVSAQIAGADERISIRAPLSGVVFFRERAPRSAKEDDPLLVIGGDDSIRLRLRMNDWQAAALKRTGEVLVQVDGLDAEPRFSANFHSTFALKHEAGHSFVELECAPSARIIRELASGAEVTAHLVWRPPLYTLLPVQMGFALLGIGGAGMLISRRQDYAVVAKHAKGETQPAASLLQPSTQPVVTQTQVELGALEPVLTSVAAQLREMVLSDDLDDAKIGAAEWSLDRHHVRAVRAFTAAFDGDPMVREKLRSLQRQGDVFDAVSERMTRGFGEPHMELRRRLLRILEVTIPANSNARGLNGKAHRNGNGVHRAK